MRLLPILAIAIAITSAEPSKADDRFVLVQSTTSTKNSGLYDWILPLFEKAYDIEARLVAVGTGQAIRNARNCDGDVLLVHSKIDEDRFVAEGFGTRRHDLMYNDFIVVGPASDPAAIAGGRDITAALSAIHDARAPFASRGDDSGTHKAEMRLWSAAGADPTGASGTWYSETGSGMGATLNISVGLGAYTLTDRATWMKFGNKGTHGIMVEGDPRLFNQYGIIAVSSTACPNVRADQARAFVDWMLSAEGQAAIAAYRIEGEQVFFPNAR